MIHLQTNFLRRSIILKTNLKWCAEAELKSKFEDIKAESLAQVDARKQAVARDNPDAEPNLSANAIVTVEIVDPVLPDSVKDDAAWQRAALLARMRDWRRRAALKRRPERIIQHLVTLKLDMEGAEAACFFEGCYTVLDNLGPMYRQLLCDYFHKQQRELQQFQSLLKQLCSKSDSVGKTHPAAVAAFM